MKRRSRRAELRDYVSERSFGECEWPLCKRAMEELAHIESIGMGGRASADQPSNVFAACRRHARISDLEGSEADLRAEIERLPGIEKGIPSDAIRLRLGIEMKRGLRTHVRLIMQRRGEIEEEA